MKKKREIFPNAPIQEALVDFRVRFDSPVSKEQFSKFNELLSGGYQDGKEIVRFNANFEFKEGIGSANHESNFAGLRFDSINNNFVLQAQVDGLTLSKLRPYRDWSDLIGETKAAWSVYLDLLKPKSIERIACRYINRFEVNSSAFDFGDYFVSAPEVPRGLPQGVSRYLLQLEVPAPRMQATVVLTQALEGVANSPPAFVLDIDVFKLRSYEIGDEKWWDDLDELGELKNQFFFESLTEKAKDLFR